MFAFRPKGTVLQSVSINPEPGDEEIDGVGGEIAAVKAVEEKAAIDVHAVGAGYDGPDEPVDVVTKPLSMVEVGVEGTNPHIEGLQNHHAGGQEVCAEGKQIFH